MGVVMPVIVRAAPSEIDRDTGQPCPIVVGTRSTQP